MVEENRVLINIQTTIDDQGELEHQQTEHMGSFFQNGDKKVLIYNEKLDHDVDVRNLMTIRQNKVTLKRTGHISMTQHFQIKQSTESFYEHPHGRLHMETYTEAIDYTAGAADDRLKIRYTLSLNGVKRKHTLEMTIKKHTGGF